MKSVFKAFVLVGAVFLAAGVSPAPALLAQGSNQSESLEDIAARFGIRASVLDISLSPSGDKIAFIGPGPMHSEELHVIDLAGDAAVRTIANNVEKNADLSSCDWATESRLVCRIRGMITNESGTLLPFDRMFAVDDDGSNIELLTERRSARALGFNQDGGRVVALDVQGEEGRILMTREYVEEITVATRFGNDESGLGVDRVNVENGRRVPQESPDPMATAYIADDSGRIRLKVQARALNRGVLTGDRTYLFRAQDSNDWQAFDTVVIDGVQYPEFFPVAVDSKKNVAFGFVNQGGFDALVEVALDGSGQGTTLLSRSDVDVDGLIRIGRQRRVVGASYATEKREVAYFDGELRALAEALAAALPETPLISIVGASSDENRLLVIASSDTQPGMVYLFDKARQSLEPLLPMRDYLEGRPMGAMTPVVYPASDGTQIPGYLTLPAGSDGASLPAIVLPHGGPAARDEWGFDWLVQFFTARGYAVLQPNFRGSSGYGDAWFGRNGFQAWDVAVGDVNDAGRWLVSEGIANPDRLAIVGWSYGGYAALQSQVLDPNLFKAVVAIAPVTDLEFMREDARRYTNYRLVDRYIGSGPHVVAGSPLQHTDRFTAPVALFHGTLDVNVAVRHSRAMAERLDEAGKQVSYTEFEDLQHGLRDSSARSQMLLEIDRFLLESM